MKTTSTLTTLGLLATLAAASLTPALADRASDQNNKNTMRNLTIAGAAVAAYGLFNHDNAATLLGAAGAALAGSQYEKDRQQQSQNNNGRYYHYGRNYGSQNQNNNWNNSRVQDTQSRDNTRFEDNNDQNNNGDRNNSRWNGGARR